MVDDESYSHFPWGKVAFEKLMTSISRSMNEVQKFYRLSRLPYALKIWCYECCAKVDESLAVRVHNLIPRMTELESACNRNITPSPHELNHLDLPNPLMFGSTDDAAKAVIVQQQSERVVPTEFEDEFDDFSTPPSADLLKKMRLDVGQSSHPPTKKQKIVEESEKVSSRVAKSKKQSNKLSEDKNLAGPSIDLSEPRVSLDKDKVVPNVEMRDADKSSAASKEKLSLSKSDLDEIKSYVRIYLMVDQYTEFLGVVKEGFASFGKEAESSYADKLQEDDRHSIDAEVDKTIKKERVTESEEALHNTDEDLSKAITLKKAKLGTTSEYRYTIVNCVVMNYIHDTYTHYHRSHSEIDLSSHVENIRSMKVALMERSICEIMQGLCIPAGHRGHADEIKELAEILSTYLTISDFFEKKDRTDWSFLDTYKKKSDQHAFDVHIVDGIVQQSSSTLDCGLFVVAYADFLSDRHQIPSSEFDPKKHRTRYASLLWDYGVNKACIGYVSDNQDPPRPKRTFIQSEDTTMIDVEP
ncbi:hypothetical protein BC332_07541 [Capsicum chinense]|nr:hypothetical protein BC332_07541 [Capsicum chinense]